MSISSIISIVFGIIFVLNILFGLVIVFQERKDIGSTWAWLLVLSFIPVLGFILYLLFAQDFRKIRLFHWDDLKKLRYEKLLLEQMESIQSGGFQFKNDVAQKNDDLIYMHLNENHALLTEDNEIDILTDGKVKFERLFQDIREAQESVHVQYYIFQRDNLGKKFLDLLTEKAKQGVKVRLLYDELGSRKLTKGFFKDFLAAGGEAEAFFPSKLHLINLRINYRNHRKLVIIDGKIGYVGGFNVGDEYLGIKKKFGYWRDTHLRVQGSAVYAMQIRFILDWSQASQHNEITYETKLFPAIETTGRVGMQIVTSGPDSSLEHIKNGYIKMIMSAKRSIYIQSPYFVPDPSVFDALRIAALSGVDVHIMIPDKPDHPFIYWATLSHVGELLKLGVKVYLYKKGFIHAKTIVVDDEISSVGTANMDYRSFRLNFEVNAFIYHEATAQKLSEIFLEDIKDSTLLTIEDYGQRPRLVRMKESISRLISPIL
ncbi:cardiolipin synthase [Paenibacillus sp. D2_2]|uniref:cardiolipin synthase n=1 Tax=Paenibacillus sp. D2_2 TaxID=3073092 RepID=UPI002815B910|nr:cardiolipin synthase [Paenibacillus sp. D2_2]WMT43518.1 cardiolipin synthase [Paenibacillus sp. D2_2]